VSRLVNSRCRNSSKTTLPIRQAPTLIGCIFLKSVYCFAAFTASRLSERCALYRHRSLRQEVLKLSSCFVAVICNEGAHLTGLNFFVKPFIFALPGGFAVSLCRREVRIIRGQEWRSRLILGFIAARLPHLHQIIALGLYCHLGHSFRRAKPVQIFASLPELRKGRRPSTEALCRSPFRHSP